MSRAKITKYGKSRAAIMIIRLCTVNLQRWEYTHMHARTHTHTQTNTPGPGTNHTSMFLPDASRTAGVLHECSKSQSFANTNVRLCTSKYVNTIHSASACWSKSHLRARDVCISPATLSATEVRACQAGSYTTLCCVGWLVFLDRILFGSFLDVLDRNVTTLLFFIDAVIMLSVIGFVTCLIRHSSHST